MSLEHCDLIWTIDERHWFVFGELVGVRTKAAGRDNHPAISSLVQDSTIKVPRRWHMHSAGVCEHTPRRSAMPGLGPGGSAQKIRKISIQTIDFGGGRGTEIEPSPGKGR